jgi:TPP-dependent pyruvate/acetoin dehydrogenase alpha subunit
MDALKQANAYCDSAYDALADGNLNDPIKLFGEKLTKQGLVAQAEIDRIDKEVTAEVEAAEKAALESPVLDPAVLVTLVYAS